MSQEKLKVVVDQILNRIPAVKGKGEQATKRKPTVKPVFRTLAAPGILPI